jgi:hypothetical protein
MKVLYHDVDQLPFFVLHCECVCVFVFCAYDRVNVRVSAPASVRVLLTCGLVVRRDFLLPRRFHLIVTIGLVMRK